MDAIQNILILLPNAADPQTGGLERVYHNLTPFLRRIGYKVYAACRISTDYDKTSVYDEVICWRQSIKQGNDPTISIVRELIQSKQIDLVICSASSRNYLACCSRLKGVKVIYHIHNVPSLLLLNSIRILPERWKGTWVDRALKRFRWMVRMERSARRIVANHQHIVLLSETFRADLEPVFPFRNDYVHAIPNPFIIDDTFSLSEAKKEKMVLYVGRLAESQKRVTSLLHIWQKIQDRLPDYRLEIVGGGPDEGLYTDLAKKLHLKRITFHGFQKPDEYYKKAVISCMTSNYEGFAMVLVEAMQYGCVPFAFESFAPIHDSIEDGKNGYIIPPFDEDKYAERILNFLNMTEEQKNVIALQAMEKSRIFDVNEVGKQWIKLIENL